MKTLNYLPRLVRLHLWLMLCIFGSALAAQASTFNFNGSGSGTVTRAWTNILNWAEGAAATNWIANGANDLNFGSAPSAGSTARQSENGGATCQIANINSITFSTDGWNTFQKIGNERIVLGAGGITNGPPSSGAYTFVSSSPPTNSQFRNVIELSANSHIVNNDTNAQLTLRQQANAFTLGTNYCLDLKTFTLTFEGSGTNTFNTPTAGQHAGGAIKGTGGIVKNGTGSTSFSATNTYSGPTTVNAGQLVVKTWSSGGGSYTLADGANLQVTVGSAGTTLNTSSLNLTSTTTNSLTIALGALGNPTVPVVYATNLTLNGTVYVTVTGSGLSPGIIPLIQYNGSIAGGGTLITNTIPTGVGAYLTNNTGTHQIQLVVSSVPSLLWGGKTNTTLVGTWDIGVTTNWIDTTAVVPASFVNGLPVLFNDNGLTNLVTLLTNVAPFSLTVSNNAKNYTLTNDGVTGFQVNGAARIIKDGPGKFVLGTTNSYSGFTYVKQGTLQLGAPSAIGGSSLVTNNATLDLNGYSQNFAALYGAGLMTNSTTTPVNLTLTAGATDGGNFAGQINEGAGPITLFKSGGELRLSGNNNYSGGTTIITGGATATRWIILGGDNVLGTGPLTFGIGGSLTTDVGVPHILTNSIYVNASGVSFGSAGAGLLTCSGPILNTSGVDQGVTIPSDVIFSGPIILTSGGLAAKDGPGALRFLNNTVTLNNVSTALKVNDGSIIVDGAIVTINGSQEARVFSTVPNGTASFFITNGGSLTINSSGQDFEIGYTGADPGSTNIADIRGVLDVNDRVSLGYAGQLAMLNVGSGGTVKATRFNAATNTVNTVINLDGATITAPEGAGSGYMEGLTSVNIRGGGVTINGLNTNSIHIRQNLLDGGGGGGLTWNGTNATLGTTTTLQLDGTNSYTGTTLINVGILGGAGTHAAPLVLASGSGLYPGGGGTIGKITVNNSVTLNSGVHCSFELNTTNHLDQTNELGVVTNVVQLATNDMLVVSGTLNVTGASLTVNNNGTNLVSGTYFKLFSQAAVGLTSVSLPALDAGLAWQNNLAVDGSIQVVVASVTPPPLEVSQAGYVLNFSWTNASFHLQSQTNSLSVGLMTNSASWLDYPGGDTSPIGVTIDPVNPTVFFRLSQ